MDSKTIHLAVSLSLYSDVVREGRLATNEGMWCSKESLRFQRDSQDMSRWNVDLGRRLLDAEYDTSRRVVSG